MVHRHRVYLPANNEAGRVKDPVIQGPFSLTLFLSCTHGSQSKIMKENSCRGREKEDVYTTSSRPRDSLLADSSVHVHGLFSSSIS
jgi:hypothetical protein